MRLTNILKAYELIHINIVKEERSPDIALFHEICHWFHFIRDAVRFSKENNWNLQISTVKDFYYFRPNIKNASDMAWSGISKNNADTHFLCEEIRNILGIINASQLVYLNGDDLCENLYRICINTYIRFGHSNDEYVESMPFVQKAINTINKNKTKYNILNKVKKSAKSVKKSISVI